jgi:hypothetical protein
VLWIIVVQRAKWWKVNIMLASAEASTELFNLYVCYKSAFQFDQEQRFLHDNHLVRNPSQTPCIQMLLFSISSWLIVPGTQCSWGSAVLFFFLKYYKLNWNAASNFLLMWFFMLAQVLFWTGRFVLSVNKDNNSEVTFVILETILKFIFPKKSQVI